MLYLNDVEEGGGTDFPELEVTVELAKLEMALKKFESLVAAGATSPTATSMSVRRTNTS